jgi:hypothetical protein
VFYLPARRIVHIPKLPLLGNGKRNYPALDRMAREGVATPATPARSM